MLHTRLTTSGTNINPSATPSAADGKIPRVVRSHTFVLGHMNIFGPDDDACLHFTSNRAARRLDSTRPCSRFSRSILVDCLRRTRVCDIALHPSAFERVEDGGPAFAQPTRQEADLSLASYDRGSEECMRIMPRRKRHRRRIHQASSSTTANSRPCRIPHPTTLHRHSPYAPAAPFHNFTVPSSLPVAYTPPSGLHAVVHTGP